MLYMRDLEKLLGWARVAFLYMVSGIGGYLAGAIFVPYKVSKLHISNIIVIKQIVGR